MPNEGTRTRGPHRSGLGLLLTAAVVAGGCQERLGPEPAPAPRAIVSNPVTGFPAAGAASRSFSSTAYVSLLPGSYPGGVRVTITNRRTGSSRNDELESGGLDPVPIEANVADTLHFSVDTAGTEPIQFDQVVPVQMLPVVVRTNPPAGKRDVPLNLRVLVVFSEPMNPASVTGATVRLELGGAAVGGTVAVSADGLEATLEPETELQSGSEYTIVVDDVRDSDGYALGAAVQAGFTTVAAGGNAVGLRFEQQPDNAIAGVTMSPVTVVAVDAAGDPAVGFAANITISLGADTGGGGLNGTVRRFGGAGSGDVRRPPNRPTWRPVHAGRQLDRPQRDQRALHGGGGDGSDRLLRHRE